MIYEFLAIIVITILLLVFAVLFLQSLSANADVRVRRDMKQLLGSYDHIIEEKSKAIRSLEEETGKLEERRELLLRETENLRTENGQTAERGENSFVLPGWAEYRTADLREQYESMRRGFYFTDNERNKLIDGIRTSAFRKGIGRQARNLKAALSFDTVSALCGLGRQEQLELLRTSLKGKDLELLDAYLAEHQENKFDITAFVNWLDEKIALEDESLVVACGDRAISEAEGYVYEASICEGIQIRRGDRLYDYCVKEREIS